MERIKFIIEQIEECKNFILNGHTTQLRMAFVLLDNAAEILMHRKVVSDLSYNEMRRRMVDSAKRSLLPEKFKEWEQQSDMTIISIGKERQIKRYFDEKVKFLSVDHSDIPKSLAAVLNFLHKYRNELYHKDRIREETIRVSTTLLFEVVCELLVLLPPGGMSSSSRINYDSPDWTKFYREYNLKKHHFIEQEDLKSISSKLRSGIVLDCDLMRRLLREHLKSRIQEVIEALDFVMRDGLRINSRSESLKCIQFTASGQVIGLRDRRVALKGFRPKYSIKDFGRWRGDVIKFDKIKNKVSLFVAFADIEQNFEELESIICEAAADLDSAIQLEIDVMRGK